MASTPLVAIEAPTGTNGSDGLAVFTFSADIDAANHELRIVRPHLPAWLERIVVRELRVGESMVDLRFERSAGTTQVIILRNEGGLRIR